MYYNRAWLRLKSLNTQVVIIKTILNGIFSFQMCIKGVTDIRLQHDLYEGKLNITKLNSKQFNETIENYRND